MADKKKVELTDLPAQEKLNEEEEKSVKGGALLSTSNTIGTVGKSSLSTMTSTSPTPLTVSKSGLCKEEEEPLQGANLPGLGK